MALSSLTGRNDRPVNFLAEMGSDERSAHAAVGASAALPTRDVRHRINSREESTATIQRSAEAAMDTEQLKALPLLVFRGPGVRRLSDSTIDLIARSAQGQRGAGAVCLRSAALQILACLL
jgi:hypothetical protein